MTRAAWKKLPSEMRPKVYTVHSPLQTVGGRIEHPLRETEAVEITFRAGSNGQVVQRLIPFLILERGGYDILFGMSLEHSVYANLDLRTETTTVYSDKTGVVSVTVPMSIWGEAQLANFVRPAFVSTPAVSWTSARWIR